MSSTENPGCLGFLLQILGIRPSQEGEKEGTVESADVYPYRVRDDFLSIAERAFYGVLCSAVGDRAVVCPKVGMSDIFFVVRPNEHRSAFNRIAQKHIDFLLCDPATMRPLLGIELDDSSHARADRQARDAFVANVFQTAQLPLLRVPVQQGYNLQELAARIDALLRARSSVNQLQLPDPPEPFQTLSTSIPSLVPSCPKCNVPMVERAAKQGEQRGNMFWGCPNYPRCRQTVAHR